MYAPQEQPLPIARETTGQAAVSRALADLDAARARVEADAEKVHRETRLDLVGQLLPVLDNLDRTLEAARAEGAGPALLQGVAIVRAELEIVLGRYGVTRVDAIGCAFDPEIHDAVATVATDDPRLLGKVVDQLAPGYRLDAVAGAGPKAFDSKLLRAAKVTVGVAAR